MRRWLLLALMVVALTAGCAGNLDSTATPTPADPGDGIPTPSATVTSNDTLQVHFINVGQGAATLIVTPANETILIDSGDWRDDGEHVLASLQRHDVTHVDYLVTSHADADHIGGHAAVIEYFETEADGVGAVYDPGITASSQTYEAYLDAVEEYDVPLYRAQRGDLLPLDGRINTTVLVPPAGYLAGEDRNENSLVLRIAYGTTGFLFPGDAASEGEEFLTETHGDALNVTVLQAGHHGSKTSSGEALLDASMPRVVVISSAYDSQYGHPHAEVLDRLADRAIPTFWTATHGDVVVTSDGQTVTVATQQEAPTDAARLREGEPIEPGAESDVEERTSLTANAGTLSGPTTEIATDGGTATPTASQEQVHLAEIHADATGADRENLTDEFLVFENRGDEPLDMSGWQVTDEADHTYTFPTGFELAPGASVTLHTGSGTDTESDLFWGSGQPVWNNDGDTVIVTTADGEHIVEEAY